MTTQGLQHRPPAYPTQSWYVAATSDEVTSSPLGRRALDTGLVLYRTSDGSAVVLEDRDAHSAYPLSLGRVEQDLIVSSYSGFAYAADGSCVRVPTQTEIPYDARVRSFPVREQDGFVWVWFAEPGLAGLRKPPSAPWLVDDSWSTLGDEWTTEASFMLLHENFADITHVAVVDPSFAPPVLSAGPVPLLEVEVTETGVSFGRSYPPAPLAEWHADAAGGRARRRLRPARGGPVRLAGSVDRQLGGRSGRRLLGDLPVHPRGHPGQPRPARVTYGGSAATSPSVRRRLRRSRRCSTTTTSECASILETMQGVLSLDGPRPDVHVAADAAALQVRKIVNRMVADEQLGGTR